MANHQAPRNKRRRLAPVALLAGVAGAGLLAMSMTNTLSAFTASITNNTNTAGSGTLIMSEDNGGTPCLSTTGAVITTNSATCSTINKYGGNLAMVPGQAVSTTVNIKNTGTAAAGSFTLTPAACTQSNNGTVNGNAADFCSKLTVLVKSGATTVVPATSALALGTGGAVTIPAGLIPTAGGASVPFTVTVTLDSAVGNTYQGLQALQALTWQFNS